MVILYWNITIDFNFLILIFGPTAQFQRGEDMLLKPWVVTHPGASNFGRMLNAFRRLRV